MRQRGRTNPNVATSEVIMIGRSLSTAPSIAASITEYPVPEVD